MSTTGNHTYASVQNLFSSRLLPDVAQEAELSGLLRTNAAPLDSSHFQSFIASSRYELARYNVDIRTLTAALDKLLSERDVLRVHANKCSSLFAPIRSLPPEILLKIFGCVPQPSESDYSFSSLARTALQQHMERLAKIHLLRLSHVCSHWRTIIMGTPSFWAAIEVNVEHWVIPSMLTRLTRLLEVAIERSGTRPLRLKIRARGLQAAPGLELLSRCSDRWKVVELDISSRFFENLSSARGNFPLLEVLDIHGDSLQNLDIFQVAPRLREVTLWGGVAVEPPSLPWEQLHTLNYKTSSTAELGAFMHLMLRCTGLTAVKFLTDLSLLSLPLALPPATLDLTSLALICSNSHLSSADTVERFSEILDSFTLPHITALSFRMHSPTLLVWTQRSFLALAARSSFRDTVTSLTVYGIMITDIELLLCLADLPQLKVLDIADGPQDHSPDHILVTDALFHGLSQTADVEYLVPRLHIFRFISLFHFTAQALLDVVASRLGSGRPFELELYWHPDRAPALDPGLVRQLDVLRREGQLSYLIEQFDAVRQ